MNESHESTKPGFGENIDRLIIYEEETLSINRKNYSCGDLMLMVCVNISWNIIIDFELALLNFNEITSFKIFVVDYPDIHNGNNDDDGDDNYDDDQHVLCK